MDIQRRNFLRGRFSAKHTVLLPPWSRSQAAFFAACVQCDECINHCPESVIRKNSDGFPQMDFTHSGCTFCGICAESCSRDAFVADLTGIPWREQVTFTQSCLTYRGVSCQSCQDSCEGRAIQFHYRAGRIPQPTLVSKQCTGCGMCVSVCPTSAIEVVPTQSNPNGKINYVS